LKGGKVFYYASVSDTKALGELNLVTSQIKRLENSKGNRKYSFEVYTHPTVYHISVETEEELAQWLNMMERVRHHIFIYGLKIDDTNEAKKPKSKGLLTSMLRPGGSKKDSVDVLNAPGGSGRSIASYGKSGKDTVIQEILVTERDYVVDLHVIKEHFIDRLVDFARMPKHEKDQIFGNIEDIIPLHDTLLRDLEAEVLLENPDLGAIFARLAPALSIYSNYCTGQSTSQESIDCLTADNENLRLCISVSFIVLKES
jgi:hypothetical protein